MKKIIFTNVFYQVLNRVITAVSTIIFTAYITNRLGVSSFGIYSIAITYLMTFYIVTDFGVNTVVAKKIAENESEIKSDFTRVIALKTFLGLFVLLVSLIVVLFLPYTKEVKWLIVLLSPILLINSITVGTYTIFQILLKYKYQFFSSLLGNFVYILLLFLLSKLFIVSLPLVLVVYVLGMLLVMLASIYFCKKYILFSKEVLLNKAYYKEVLIKSFPIGITLLLNSLMIHIDRLMMSFYSSSDSVGIYNLAYKIFDLVLIVPTYVMNVMYPILVRSYKKDHDLFVLSFLKLVIILVLLSLSITILGNIYGNYFIKAIWGEAMLNSVVPLSILLLGLIVFYVTAPITWLLIIKEKQANLPVIYLIGLIVTAVLCYLYIPIYGYIAAAIITIVGELVILILLIISLLQGKKNRLSYLIKFATNYDGDRE